MSNDRKDPAIATHRPPVSEIQVVVEVDGNPVGFLNLDINRLWPLIDHHKREAPAVDWIDPERLETVIRAAAIKNFINRLQSHLYQSLGQEIVKAQLNVESLTLRAEAVAQAFGRTQQDIESLVEDSGRSLTDFQAFFWECLVDDQEPADLKKKWKAAAKE